jgi:hypothetical protein
VRATSLPVVGVNLVLAEVSALQCRDEACSRASPSYSRGLAGRFGRAMLSAFLLSDRSFAKARDDMRVAKKV